MSQIILDDEQAKVLTSAGEPVEILDRHGTSLGVVAPGENRSVGHGVSEEDIALAKQRAASDDPRYTTREVLDYLGSQCNAPPAIQL